MNLNQLKYFLAIVKTGSFSNAADDMYISQSSMSKQIKALETELGVDLFKREHSKVYLTEIGAEFAKYAEMTIKQHNDMLLYLDEFATKKSNTIRFGSIPVVSSYGISAMSMAPSNSSFITSCWLVSCISITTLTSGL
jgi:LysR family transcriptional regulator, transcription activator of glutamate synthase operon